MECDENPCLNGGTCNLQPDGFRCSCPAGYEGQLCETDVNDCEPNPCKNGGFCTDRVANYQCECAAGYTGVDCSTNVDDCESNPCQNGGTCSDLVNGFQCDCSAGYTGARCEVDVDDCASVPCANGADCQDEVNGFTCICQPGTTGPTCSNTVEPCKEDTCKNGGTCEDGENGFKCTCAAGYNGVNCENDIDDCAALPCQNGAPCTDAVNGYTCTCPDGYEGVNCENLVDPCNPNPCQNDGSCTSAGDYYVCSCPAGYNGADCEQNIDDCASNPCANGASCTDGINGFTCTCTTGYTGPTCNNEPPTCPQTNPCDHGTCKDGVDGYMCECDAGYSGATCSVNVDDCHGDPCGAHGTCMDGANKFTCACELGYDGPRCQNNIDDCKDEPCKNAGSCNDLVNGFECQCAPGWAGETCEANIDECGSDPCLHGGSCQDGINSYTCTCTPGWTGDNCETDECTLIGVCGNGTCDGQGGCTCDSGWQGAKCDQNIDECTVGSPPCLHGGNCTDSPGSFMCECTMGYTGVLCDQCTTGYQDNDDDGVCCPTGYAGLTCQACDDGYESVNGLCKKTCSSSPIDCGAHGTCDSSGNEPACVCDSGYFGPSCDSFTGMCSGGTPCGANGDCSMTSDTTYKCVCDVGYIGRNCEEVDECAMAVANNMTPCQNGGTCIDGNNAYTCQCASGWLGADCSEADNCVQGVPQDGPCSGHGLCTDGNNAYTCACVTGWLGATCAEQDNCVGNTCQRGVCVDGDATYTCDCNGTGYDGDRCQNKIDYCASTPCKHGGVCSDAVTTFQCDCAHTGFTGTTCEDDADECADTQLDVCGDGACTNGGSGDGYRCQCPDGTIDVDHDGRTCSQAVSVAAGALNTCAITALGSLHCWGDNASAELGQGSAGNPGNTVVRSPVRIGTGTGWQKVSVGAAHVCAIRSGHLYCWGSDSKHQAGGVTSFQETQPLELRGDLTWTDVSVGDEHSCALAGTALYCWGNTVDGQAGTATSGSTVDAPQQIAGSWSKLSAGSFHTCAINSTNQLRCWGRNTSNQVGATQPIPVPAGNNGDWTSVKAGPTHTCAVAGAKTYCWGAGTEGSLGNGAFSDSATAVEVSGVSALGSLATGDKFSCGVVNDGGGASTFQIYCWGSNQYSLLLTADAKVNVPQLVTRGGTPAWTAYAVGAHHMCAIDAGLLYCWGSNVDGALGSGVPDPTPVSVATLVKTPATLHSVIDNCTPNPCKNQGICASSASGYTCDCTGTGFGGTNCTSETDECTMNPTICGQGTCRDRLDGDGYTCTCPDGLIDLDNTGTTCVSAKAISGGYNHTCVLTTSNTLHCWGSNRYGQFGLGAVGTGYYSPETSQTIRTPLRIKNVSGISTTNASGWTNFGVGESHTCGTIPNTMGAENLYCWGNNAQGQLGRAIASATDNEPAPYLLDSTRTWTALSVGYAHNCGISGGQLYCWGYNPYGQVGNGNQTTPALFSSTPVTLPGGETSWTAVAAGGSHTCAVTNTNTTYCWGRQQLGQTGQGATSTTPRTTPGKTSKTDPQGFTAIQADINHVCGLVGTDGYCWGLGVLGGIGDGGTTNRPAPTLVSGGLSFSSLTLGQNYGCGLVAVMGSNPQAYTLSCWGNNAKNILLDNTKTQVNAPQAVLASRQWRVVDAAPLHICAVDNTDGKLY